jgi:hypothetical protein
MIRDQDYITGMLVSFLQSLSFDVDVPGCSTASPQLIISFCEEYLQKKIPEDTLNFAFIQDDANRRHTDSE